ncbi:MAG: hypothetical protein PHP10_03075 [Candidatus Omnitrophica bacterium]|nr:hypothetical protein [Candidatus Omnitrophota bacterium]
MLDKRIRVLNFDNSVRRQSRLFSQYQSEIIDLTEFASSARLYMSGALRKRIAGRISSSGKNSPTFLGSGDFHHISEILTGSIDQPFCLVVFDAHPDWDILPPRFGCGSWVSRAVENRKIPKILLIGALSGDLSSVALETGNLGALRENRLEIYPYSHKCSRVFFRRIPRNNSVIVRRGLFSDKVTWHRLENEELGEFTLKLIRRLPANKVYISIDKDCLKKEFALTNWEEGSLRLNQLLTMLKVMRDNLDIIGLDVTGDYSPSWVSGSIKAVISRLDHPREFSGRNYPDDLMLRVNEEANLKILQELFS